MTTSLTLTTLAAMIVGLHYYAGLEGKSFATLAPDTNVQILPLPFLGMKVVDNLGKTVIVDKEISATIGVKNMPQIVRDGVLLTQVSIEKEGITLSFMKLGRFNGKLIVYTGSTQIPWNDKAMIKHIGHITSIYLAGYAQNPIGVVANFSPRMIAIQGEKQDNVTYNVVVVDTTDTVFDIARDLEQCKLDDHIVNNIMTNITNHGIIYRINAIQHENLATINDSICLLEKKTGTISFFQFDRKEKVIKFIITRHEDVGEVAKALFPINPFTKGTLYHGFFPANMKVEIGTKDIKLFTNIGGKSTVMFTLPYTATVIVPKAYVAI